MTPFTSFVAIEKARVTIGGRALLVPVPIELPQGTRFDGFFGEWRGGPIPVVEGMSRGIFGSAGDDENGREDFGVPPEAAPSAPIVAGAVPDPTSAAPAQSAAVPNTAPAPVVAPSAPAGGRVVERTESLSRSRRLAGGDAGGMPGGMIGGGGGGSQGAAGGFGGGAKGKMESMASRPAKPAAPAAREQSELKRQSTGGLREPAAGTSALADVKQDVQADATRDARGEARDASHGSEPTEEPSAPIAPAEDPVIVLYDVRDLVGLGADQAVVTQATERLVRELQKLTGRELWTDQGGRSAAWSAQDGLLRIEALPSLQRMIDSALRTRRSAMGATGGIDRDLVPAEAAAAITSTRARVARPLTTAELDRAWDLLGAELFRAALLGARPSTSSSTMPDGSVWVSIAVTENSPLGALAARLSEPGINEAARVVVGRALPARLAELVQDPAITAVNVIPAP